jgi:hypothetical protein
MHTQLQHIKSLIEAANKAGVKTYIAPSNEKLWDDPNYDEFFNT